MNFFNQRIKLEKRWRE